MQGAEAAAAMVAQVQLQWEQWRGSALERGLRIPAAAVFLSALRRVWEASEYVSLSLAREPEL